jgi:hypothetical protein
VRVAAAGALLRVLASPTGAQPAPPAATVPRPLDRSTLAIALPEAPPIREIDVRKVPTPPHVDVVAPGGAPKVVVLVDDTGFGAPGRMDFAYDGVGPGDGGTASLSVGDAMSGASDCGRIRHGTRPARGER